MSGKEQKQLRVKKGEMIIKQREGSVDGKMRDGMGSRGGCRVEQRARVRRTLAS
jgi:hypothetical protein